jgi:UDP-2,3-diacylglucosamine pyrophosphatase LpxH
MPGKAVIAISDLHLGRRNAQDSFMEQPETVKEFARQVAAGASSSRTPLTFILNGDVFDLWELVTDVELGEGQPAYDAISTGLLAPTDTSGELARLADGVKARLHWSLEKHPEIIELLNRLTAAGVKVHINVGNHDHQLDNQLTAAVLRQAITDHGGPSAAIPVARYYLDPELGFYAEHGDQFAGGESKSPLHDVNGAELEEATGFYFLRYVWNRLENKGHGWVQHPNMAQILKLIAKLVIKREGPVQEFLRYCSDYFRAVRDKGVPLVDSWIVKRLYDVWRIGHPLEAVQPELAGADELTEQDLDVVRDELAGQELAAPEAALPPEAAETIAEAPLVEPPLKWLPGVAVTPQPAKGDGYIKGVRSRFKRASDGFPKLDPAIRTVTIGHTHEERQLKLSGDSGPLYYNSGSWTKGHRTVYVWCYTEGASFFRGMNELAGW